MALRLPVLGRMLADDPEEIVSSYRNCIVPTRDTCERPSRPYG